MPRLTFLQRLAPYNNCRMGGWLCGVSVGDRTTLCFQFGWMVAAPTCYWCRFQIGTYFIMTKRSKINRRIEWKTIKFCIVRGSCFIVMYSAFLNYSHCGNEQPTLKAILITLSIVLHLEELNQCNQKHVSERNKYHHLKYQNPHIAPTLEYGNVGHHRSWCN